MVRAGRNGEHEDLAIEGGVAASSLHEGGDVRSVSKADDIKEVLRTAYPEKGERTVGNWTSQLWQFVSLTQVGDIVALPFKSQPSVAFGRVTGPYHYVASNPPGARHTRDVTWLRTDVPRSAIGQDLLQSLETSRTVCAITRNNAEHRIRKMLGESSTPTLPSPGTLPTSVDTAEPEPPLNLEQVARDRVRARIASRFKNEDFDRLIDAILTAQGYVTARTDAGADGDALRLGVGFDPPRLAVQVKSSENPEGKSAVRELHGVLRRFNADRGLFVSWGGFKTSVLRRFRELFFEVRLWTADDVIDAVQDNYERLPEDIRVDIPLTRMWSLAEEEE